MGGWTIPLTAAIPIFVLQMGDALRMSPIMNTLTFSLMVNYFKLHVDNFIKGVVIYINIEPLFFKAIYSYLYWYRKTVERIYRHAAFSVLQSLDAVYSSLRFIIGGSTFCVLYRNVACLHISTLLALKAVLHTLTLNGDGFLHTLCFQRVKYRKMYSRWR